MRRCLIRYLLSLSALICLSGANAQHDSLIYIGTIGWHIDLPAGYTVLNGDFISKTTNVETLLTVSNAQGDFLYISCDSSEKLTKKDWEVSDAHYIIAILNAIGLQKFINHTMYTGSVSIDGIRFKQVRVDCTKEDHSVLHVLFLSSFYKHHYIFLNYFYHNNPYELLAMFDQSTFDRLGRAFKIILLYFRCV